MFLIHVGYGISVFHSKLSHTQVALNPFWILSHNIEEKLRDKIWNGKPEFEAIAQVPALLYRQLQKLHS